MAQPLKAFLESYAAITNSTYGGNMCGKETALITIFAKCKQLLLACRDKQSYKIIIQSYCPDPNLHIPESPCSTPTFHFHKYFQKKYLPVNILFIAVTS